MAAIPYMPLYIADYMADAAHLTTLEHGAYLLLIMTYWQRGKPLDNSNGRLANVARMSNEEWKSVEQTLSEFFTIEGEVWKHKRIESELDKFRVKSDKASKAGKASALRRSEGKNTHQQTLNECSTDVQRTFNHTDTDTDTDKKELKILTTFVQKKPTQEILPIIDESPTTPFAETKKPKSDRATRLPNGRDWVLPDDWGEWAMEKFGWSVDEVVDTATEFRNYWAAEGGAKGRKVDWELTWQNRCREIAKRKESQRLKDEKYEQIRFRRQA